MKTQYFVKYYVDLGVADLWRKGWFRTKLLRSFNNMDDCVDYLYNLSEKKNKELDIKITLKEGK